MLKSKIIEVLETIEGQLDDAYSTLPEYNANSEGKSYIDGARCDLYYLKEEIEKDNYLSNKHSGQRETIEDSSLQTDTDQTAGPRTDIRM
tara:strand:+ start:393 stop:662 length:270 start_codon:yes stop_codon:yes gene_type:complete